ncbi:MAG TPA: phosphatase PAP2 family protein [Saprospiraceae bacterium]|jgi:membrane-associated phospholipid phosphatase|nr:phosphatase PAP2 family protein [Saprospiraceae bacterium]MCC6688296.1 phosphatase PAP2 family protein [Saprospiraceae bacterium]HMX83422.1 phosphatase PAP2 family protein [Saprospiraceae bacterium]HMX85516.1 phosphatase PAP2 family protein [Saprospiraceae bacterium]HMZ73306.1 phosphatase PAP2 family protein [Saprospiraceae bacterium]
MYDVDFQIFHFVNDGLSNTFFDWVAPVLREKKTWIPLYIALLIWLIYKYQKKSVLIIGLIIAVAGITDYTSSSIIKPFVKRVRPCNDQLIELQVNERVTCGAGYSFPSSHAANHFAIAFFLSLTIFRKYRLMQWLSFLWAALIALSQVYVGVHYPADIFGGAVLGMLIAMMVYYVSSCLWEEYLNYIET